MIVTRNLIADQLVENQRRYFDSRDGFDPAKVFGNPGWWDDLSFALRQSWERSILPDLVSVQPMNGPISLIEGTNSNGERHQIEVRAVPRRFRAALPDHARREDFVRFFMEHQVSLTREVLSHLTNSPGYRYDAPHPLEALAYEGTIRSWIEERLLVHEPTHVFAHPETLKLLGVTVPALDHGEIRRVLDPRPVSFWTDALFPTKKIVAWRVEGGSPLVFAPYVYQWSGSYTNPQTMQTMRGTLFRYALKLTNPDRIYYLERP